MDPLDARARFRELREQDGPVDPAELDGIWAALATVRPEEILGEWKGGEFHTGHPLNGALEKAGWYGKTFASVHDAKPLICRDATGALFSDRELGKGEASLWTVEFRGEATATMVYDGQPVFDHFKRVDDTTLMGIMNVKGVPAEGPFFYFFLERAPGAERETTSATAHASAAETASETGSGTGSESTTDGRRAGTLAGEDA